MVCFAAFYILGRELGGIRAKNAGSLFPFILELWDLRDNDQQNDNVGVTDHLYNLCIYIYEERERPAVRVGSCGALAVQIIALELGHHFVSPPIHAVAVAEIDHFCRNFVHSEAPRGVIDL